MSEERRRLQVRVTEAGPGDDEDLRALLRANPMPGAISVTFEREPNFFLGGTIEGEWHRTMIARDAADRATIGLATMSRYNAFQNGKVVRQGYLSQLRVDAKYRGHRGPLRAGFRLLEEWHRDDHAPLYLTTVIEDNTIARRVLERDWPGKPHYREREVILSLALPLWRRRRVRPPAGIEIRRAGAEDLGALAECLQRNHARYQFAPVWTPEDLASEERCRGLRVEDFRLATKNGRVVGCLAAWDQSGFKQTVIHGYEGFLGRARPGWNAVARLLKAPRLPNPGEPLHSIFLSHAAVDDDDPATLVALVTSAYNDAVGTKHAFAMVGLAERNPMTPALRRAFRAIEYRSVLYVTHWDDGDAAAEALDGRVPHVEIAIL